eukprot:30989-Pelagococcus_subviridis.AAC.6
MSRTRRKRRRDEDVAAESSICEKKAGRQPKMRGTFRAREFSTSSSQHNCTYRPFFSHRSTQCGV